MTVELEYVPMHSVYRCAGYVVHVAGGPRWLLFRETRELALTDGAAYVAKHYPDSRAS